MVFLEKCRRSNPNSNSKCNGGGEENESAVLQTIFYVTFLLECFENGGGKKKNSKFCSRLNKIDHFESLPKLSNENFKRNRESLFFLFLN